MRAKIPLIIVLASWLFASGAHWDFVQVFAWGRMLATYRETMSFSKALEATFDADKPCSICQLVGKAKQKEQSSSTGAPRAPEEMIYFFQPQTLFVMSVQPEVFGTPSDQSRGSAEQEAPPNPPPRAKV